MIEALSRAVLDKGRPFLGICVGMQLMAPVGREHGEHAGLGWIDGDVALLPAAGNGLKIPHMGWNDLVIRHPEHPVLAGIASGDARLLRPLLRLPPRRSGGRAGLGRLRRRRSPRWSAATIWSAPSSTRRRARRPGCG